MSCLLLFFSSFILDLSPVDFFLASLLGGFVSLSDDQLGVNDLFVLLLLALHDLELGLFQDLHPGLLKGLATKDIEHWLYFLVEVEKLVVALEDLSCLAALFGRHFWSEKGYRWSVQVKLGCNTLLTLWWLISQDFFVRVGLDIHVKTTWDWLRRWNITIWIDVSCSFGGCLENS